MSEHRGKKSGTRMTLTFMFWSTVFLLALSLIFTIVGSAVNHDGLLNAGIIGWLATSFIFFAWLVFSMLVRTKRYKKQDRFKAS